MQSLLASLTQPDIQPLVIKKNRREGTKKTNQTLRTFRKLFQNGLPYAKQASFEYFLQLKAVCVQSGLITLDDPEGIAAVSESIDSLFQVLVELAQEVATGLEAMQFTHSNNIDSASLPNPSTCVDALERARHFCTVTAFPDTLVALHLLRRKLRRLGNRARDPVAVVSEVNDIVCLLAPGVSVMALYQENPTSSARLWDQLKNLMTAMDRYCPGTPPPELAEPPQIV